MIRGISMLCFRKAKNCFLFIFVMICYCAERKPTIITQFASTSSWVCITRVLSCVVDSFVSIDGDVIMIEDAEKCLTFYPPTTVQTYFTNDKSIHEWYDIIENGIHVSQKKHRVCHICNNNCEYSAEMDESVQATGMLPENRESSKMGKESLKCITCRGCGRSICVNCIPCMKANLLQDATDKTLYCLYCRNWNRREFGVNGSCYYAVANKEEGEWRCAVNDKNQPQFWYNDKKEVSWEQPKEGDVLDESSYCDEKVVNRNTPPDSVNRLCYKAKDGRNYFYNCDTNQVQWKETMNVAMNTRSEKNVCLKCGYEMKNWSVVCPQCNQRWSVYWLCSQTRSLRECFQQNGGDEQQQSDDLRGPRGAVRAAELLVHEHAKQGRHQQRATTQRVADRIAETVARAGVAEVAEREEAGGPDGGPALRPGCGEVVLPTALGSLEGVAHDDATVEAGGRRD